MNAVKIGPISHNAAVTEAERQHGHRCTDSLDTLERDAAAAGLAADARALSWVKTSRSHPRYGASVSTCPPQQPTRRRLR